MILLHLFKHSAVIPADTVGIIALYRGQRDRSSVVHRADRNILIFNGVQSKCRKKTGIFTVQLHKPHDLILKTLKHLSVIRQYDHKIVAPHITGDSPVLILGFFQMLGNVN